ncbi:peptidase S28 [Epithele typhae]|uniref:peptidase S28 n=1 Tax=Epithele typhae TaxID=378194 RepID=UPI00200835CB|nr:peptidase S28 [Epithele typhae]KAH9938998.1 peptidase S28 [Epithele typhae]
MLLGASQLVGTALLAALSGAQAFTPVSPLAIKLAAKQPKSSLSRRQSSEFPLYNFTQPLDHFQDTGFTFQQRYWLSDRHYKPGGPVIVFEAGEGPGDARIPILDTGIVDILANATNGLGIILEHRYYGESIPVLNFTTDSLRWLNNEQAAADSANFIDNVTFPGIDADLTAPGTPWIYYGGSYGGARAAHMRVLYPDLVFGAISSSGVVHATVDDYFYFDIIRQFAPAPCMARVAEAIEEVDALLEANATHDAIKDVFGLSGLSYDPDFASLLSSPLGGWQNTNWDPSISSLGFARFCAAIGPVDNATVATPQGITVKNSTFAYAKYIIKEFSSACPPEEQDQCFGSITDKEFYEQTDLSQTWRTWSFQVCTQWGFFMTPPPDPSVPRIISKLLTIDYGELTCKLAYAPGEFFTVPPLPDVESVNKLGSYNIAADRLAIIDGQADPWRGDCPHSPDPAAKPRPDTTLRPFKLILNGSVHHWDENGLANPSAEPPFIHEIHQEEIAFVKAWLEDFVPPS